MRIILEKIVSVLYPPRESQLLVAGITALTPQQNRFIYKDTEIVFFFTYHSPQVRALVTEAKFHNNPHAKKLLGISLRHMLANYLSENTVIVPVPLSARRYRTRGYNQVEEIITAGNLPYQKSLLSRSHRTAQSSLDRQERLQNVTGSFSVPPTRTLAVENKKIILVDDVATTGATLAAARAELARHNPESIICIALAH